jgi:formylglycine-generating enzyme required for sulfatase activity/predicted MPP superfamily phosphohydrolase
MMPDQFLMESDYKIAKSAVDRFVKRFEPSYRLLLYHAALPLVLTPELLNYLRTEFLQREVPWIAEVDLLLSELCQPAGRELYTMETAVRAYLLREMKQDPALGPQRMEEVARRLIHYIRHLSKTNAFLDAQELQAQQWGAMVYIEEQRRQAAQEIQLAFEKLTATRNVVDIDQIADAAEAARLVRITQELAPGLEEYPQLMEYATQVTRLLTSRDTESITGISTAQKPTGRVLPEQRTGEIPTVSTITWLHLSDLHFSTKTTYDNQIIREAILDDIAQCIRTDNLQPDFIVISGDIASSSQPEEYTLAEEFLDHLLEVTDLPKERLFLVPGNHDVDRQAITPLSASVSRLLNDRDVVNEFLANETNRALVFQRFRSYQAFINEYFEGQNQFDSEQLSYSKEFQIGDLHVAVLGLNSAGASGSDEDRGQLILGERQVREALQTAKEADLRIAVMHHPFDWLRKLDRRDVEPLLFDNCDYILHGHIHRTDLLQARTLNSKAMMIGAGACYETRRYPNFYSFVQLDLAASEGTVYLRGYSDQQGGYWTKGTAIYHNVDDGTYVFSLSEKLHRRPFSPYPQEPSSYGRTLKPTAKSRSRVNLTSEQRKEVGSDRLALIIANGDFEDPCLSRLSAPTRDAVALASVLGDPDIGGFDVTLLVDKPEHEVRRTVARFYHRRKRDDLLLLYYSGLGIRDAHGDLYLAVQDTEMEIVSGAALSASFVREQIDKSQSMRKVIVLDCDYSGAFAGAMAEEGDCAGTKDAFAGRGYGRVILTASDAVELAYEGGSWLGENTKSVFTHYMVEGLRTGAADLNGDGLITLDELYRYVYDMLLSSGYARQTPHKFLAMEGDIFVAQAPRPVAALPDWIFDALPSSVFTERLAAIVELAQIAQGEDPKLAAAARAELEQVQETDTDTTIRGVIADALGYNLAITSPIRLELVRVPAGPFLMGSDLEKDKYAWDNERPQHFVEFPEYYISKYAVTNAQYAVFVKAAGHRVPRGWGEDRLLEGKKDHPVVSVSWYDAVAFCAWLSLESGRQVMLPSEAEWEKAARGPDGRVYPWGDDRPTPELCNYNYNMNIGGTTPVGEYSPQGDSPYGCADMAGNVWEWTSSLWDKDVGNPTYAYPYDPDDDREDLEASNEHRRVLRGGSFDNKSEDIRSAYRISNVPDARGPMIGFRVVMTPKQK